MENSEEIIWKDQVASQSMSLEPSNFSNKKLNEPEKVDEGTLWNDPTIVTKNKTRQNKSPTKITKKPPQNNPPDHKRWQNLAFGFPS